MDSRQKPFVLEKRPNLLSCSLLLPLLNPDVPINEAQALAERVGKSSAVGSFPPVTHVRQARAPYLSISRSGDLSVVNVSIPSSKHPGDYEEYIKVMVDCPIDIDRSVLNAHGDYLNARLAFGEYSSARDTRQGLDILLNNAEEFKLARFTTYGLKCRSCSFPLIPPDHIRAVTADPRLPWFELIECMTCVKPEDYFAQNGILDKPSFKQHYQRSELHALHVADAYVALSLSTVPQGCRVDSQSHGEGFLFESTPTTTAEGKRANIACASCGEWVGESEVFDGGHEMRFAKYAIECEDIFHMHSLSSCLTIILLNAVKIRECHRFLLGWLDGNKFIPFVRLIVISFDTWIATNLSPTLRPVVKANYWTCKEGDKSEEEAIAWAARINAQRITLPNAVVAKAVLEMLSASSLTFPHTLRQQHDGSVVGFLYIF